MATAGSKDSSYPVQSSTNTMTIRVCRCDSDGSILSCNVEAIFLPVGLSTGALIAILLCIVILLGYLLLPGFSLPKLLAIKPHHKTISFEYKITVGRHFWRLTSPASLQGHLKNGCIQLRFDYN
uniref:Uncharacterized protein n=1 Tax=Pavo cristatus TaxID=9049 RepID=A0A8C9FLH9_PAVCR